MIIARCDDCNYVAKYNSKYYSIEELQRHANPDTVIVQDECIHDLKYKEEES